MEKKFLAGIDIGTTGSKAAIFGLSGKIIATGYKEYKCIYPRPNWVEQDLQMMLNSAAAASRECIAKSNIDISSVLAISLSAQRSCTIFMDKSKNEIMPMISWQDGRTTSEVETIENIVGKDKYYEITGLPLGTTWLLPKILWLKKTLPGKWKKVYKIIQLHDYFLKKLGADDFFVDIPDAAFYGLWDTDKLFWSKDLMEAFKLDSDLFSKPEPSGKVKGKLSREASDLFGFKEGTPLCIGAGDQNSAVIGAGVIKEGDLSISIGTGGIAITFLNKPFRDPNKMNMITNHAITGKWQMEGLQNGAAGVFRWFRDEIALFNNKLTGNDSDPEIYRILDDIVEKTPAGSKGLILLPYLAGSAAPRWNSNARGTLIGLTFAHDKACLARCFMEGITLEMKDIINSIIKSGIKITNARLIGGASKADIWNQIQADMYRMSVSTLKISDAAILGAAILAGVGSDVFETIPDGVKKMVVMDKKYDPSKNAYLYDRLYDIYCKAYQQLDNGEIFDLISELQKEY
jgi:xylulokinase